jgi:tetratricopeptide (TPR) repeat protein
LILAQIELGKFDKAIDNCATILSRQEINEETREQINGILNKINETPKIALYRQLQDVKELLSKEKQEGQDNQEKYSVALGILKNMNIEYIEENDQHAYWGLLGTCYYNLEDYENAEKGLENSFNIGNAFNKRYDHRIVFNLILTKIELGDFIEAKAMFEILNKDPDKKIKEDYARASNKRGRSYVEKVAKIREKIKTQENTQEKDKQQREVLSLCSKALECLSNAVELNEKPEYLIDLARIQYYTHKHEDAFVTLNRASQLCPENDKENTDQISRLKKVLEQKNNKSKTPKTSTSNPKVSNVNNSNNNHKSTKRS